MAGEDGLVLPLPYKLRQLHFPLNILAEENVSVGFQSDETFRKPTTDNFPQEKSIKSKIFY